MKTALNCCPVCGGIVNIIADIPCRIILKDKDTAALGYRAEDLFQMMHDEIAEGKEYECTCDDCNADLFVIPTDNPYVYQICCKHD